MPKEVITHEPATFTQILDIVETFQASSTVSWYRGVSDASHMLKPSLYRHKIKTGISDIANLEIELTTRFVQRSLPFMTRTFSDEWDKLFLMQHYGVPTRLLDWSENPFVSIYFALTGQDSKKSDAAIWLCDPVAWNRSALSHLSFGGGILDQSSTLIRAYAPGSNVSEIPNTPIMIYGSYNSPRIVAQRGGFALFGQSTDPMEKFYHDNKISDNTLQKILVKKDHIPEILESLFRKGFTESVVFPDLDGLSREIRRTFGF